MARGDATARDYPKLQNGSSTRGLEDADPETREAVLALRGDWKFYAVFSFCHTFRAVLRLPAFSADRLERALLDPAREVVVIELILRLIEEGSRTVRLEVNDWERRLKRRVRQIAHETDYFEDAYPDPETESDEEAGDGEEEEKANDGGEIPSDPPVLETGDREEATVAGDGDEDFAVDEDVDEDDDESARIAAAPRPRGYPLRGRKTFFDLAPSERLDVLNALCEHCLESDEACVDEVAAMAAAHAAVSGDAYQCHPEAHGECVGVDAESRAYFASGDDARLWRWERPAGVGGHRASDAQSQKDPGFGTVCADARECRAFALSLEASKSAKDRALLCYLRETHLPLHDAAEEKAARAARLESARLEDLERRRAMKASYDEMDRKRSGRIAVKIAEDAERRRLREEAEEAEAEAVAVAKARDAATHRSRVRWMLLPPRLRPAEAPEGMDAADGPESGRAPGGAEAAGAGAGAGPAEDPPGAETVGRYVRVLWADDGAWYDAIVTKFANDRHTLRYLADDTVETLDLRAERKLWCPAEDYVTPAGAPIPPPAREPAGLAERGVKSGEDASGSTVLFVRKPKRLCEDAGAARVVGADADGALVGDGAPDATKQSAADDSGERKRHACRVCLRNGVVSEDHFKFGKRCPFHPQHAKPTKSEGKTEKATEGDEGVAKEEARASGSVGEGRASARDAERGVAVAVARAPPSADFPPQKKTETPPVLSSEADERPTGPTGAAPQACGFPAAVGAVSSAAF